MLIDTHAHICDPVFDLDRSAVLTRAKSAGITMVIAVSETLWDAEHNIKLASRYPSLRPAAGLYPTYLDLQQARAMIALIHENREKLYAIGEVGLDFWSVKKSPERETQEKIFRMFIEAAKEVDLPLNVHSRSAGRHAVAILLENNAHRVQLHAFDGKTSSAMSAVESGYFFSIPPSIIRSRQKQKLVKQLPLSCLLIESDSPVLGPTPEVRNEPENAVIAIDAIAELKGIPKEKVIEAVIDNTSRLYGDLRRIKGTER